MAHDDGTVRSRVRRFLPGLWCLVSVALLGVVVITTVPAWLVAVWIAATVGAVTRLGRTEFDSNT